MKMRNLTVILLSSFVLVFAAASPGICALSIHFTADDIINTMSAQGAPLSDATNQWGLWAVRVRPVVTGGGFTITGASTNQVGWGVSAPSWYSWHTYGTACAWFYDESGAEVSGTAANPLYMITDVSADTFWSSSFNGSGAWVGDYSPGGGGTFYASGYDGGAGGTNLITQVTIDSFFDVFFELDIGATWDGTWQFLVDGSKYTTGTYDSPGVWVENFFGDYGSGGGLVGNIGSGYTVIPEPATMIVWGLLGLVAAGYGVWRRRR